MFQGDEIFEMTSDGFRKIMGVNSYAWNKCVLNESKNEAGEKKSGR